MEWVPGTVRGKVYVPKVEEEVVTKKEYDSDDEDDVKTEVTHNSSMLDEETNQALMAATAGDIQDIADILGVTFQEHCMATPLKVRRRSPTCDSYYCTVLSRSTLPRLLTTPALTR